MFKFMIAAAAASAALTGAAFAGGPAAAPAHARAATPIDEIVVVARTHNDYAERRMTMTPLYMAAMDARLRASMMATAHARVANAIDAALVAPALPVVIASL